MNCDNQNNNSCGCNCNPYPAPTPADISMNVCDRNINMLPMLQTYTTKVLKPNIEGCCKKNILTQQMMNCEGYKYVIKWDFDLDGKTITVPNNCILEFDGGSLKNGTIVGQDTVFINVGDVDIWGENLTREGIWREKQGGNGGIPDKEYDPEHNSGLGRKTLELDGDSNVLTQEDFDKENTIYVIQYDFTLGEDITVPENCVLEFDGGSISGNHTITGNSTCIQARLVKVFNADITFAGTWNVNEAYPEWFTNDFSVNVTNAVYKASIISPKVIFDSEKTYYVTNLTINTNTEFCCNGATIKHWEPTDNIDCIKVTNATLIIRNAIIDGNYNSSIQGYYNLLLASIGGSLQIYDSEISDTKGNAVVLGYREIDGDYAHDCKLVNSKVTQRKTSGSCGDCVIIEKCLGALVKNCIIKGGLSSVRSQYYCRNIIVEDCDISDNFADVCLTFALSEHCIGRNNKLHGAHGNGVEVRGVVDCILDGNEIYDNPRSIYYNLYEAPAGTMYDGVVSDKYTNIPGNTQDSNRNPMPCIDIVIKNNIIYNSQISAEILGYNLLIENNKILNKSLVFGNNDGLIDQYMPNMYFIINNNTITNPDVYAIAHYQLSTRKIYGKNNFCPNSTFLSSIPIIGENVIIDLKDFGVKYLTSEGVYRINDNTALFEKFPISNGTFTIHIVGRADQPSSFHVVLNEYTPNDEFVKTWVGNNPNLNLTTEFTEHCIEVPMNVPDDYKNKFVIEIFDTSINNVHLREFTISGVVIIPNES